MFRTLLEILIGPVMTLIELIEWLINSFEDLVFIIQLLKEFVLRLPDFFSWLPSEAVTLLSIIFAVVVIYKVLGREG